MNSQRLDPFRLLLNDISHELTEKNLQSLLHISGVPDGVRENIKDGLTLFRHMIKQNQISHEKIGNLHRLMRKIRPARKDLVRRVENYIEAQHPTDNFRTVLSDLSESVEQIEHNSGGSVTVPIHEQEERSIDCRYRWGKGSLFCYLPAILLLLFLTSGTVVFGYDTLKKVAIDDDKAFKKRNIIHILVWEIFLLFLVICLGVKRVIDRRRLAGQRLGYTQFRNPGIQAPREIVASTSAVELTKNTDTQPAQIPKRVKKLSEDRPSPESAVFSIYTSGELGSMSTYGGRSMSMPRDKM